MLTRHGRIDCLLNNARGQFASPIESISAKGWDAVIGGNLTGGFLMSQACYRQHMREHGGSIVNITADYWGSWPNMAHSAAARAGMQSFTENAALEWAASGVRVNAVAPGYVASSGMDHCPPERREFLRGLSKTVPLQRWALSRRLPQRWCFCSARQLPSSPERCCASTAVGRRPAWAVSSPEHRTSTPYDGFHLASRPQVLDGIT